MCPPTGAAEAGCEVGHPLLGVDVPGCLQFERGVTRYASPEQLGERLESAFARDRGAGAAFGFVGEVQVLERLLRLRRVDGGFERVVEFALFVDALEDRGAAFVELREILRAVAHVAELDFVEPAGDFLTVAGDEGKGVAFAE